MRKIEWKPGYYEWHLLIDDQLAYVEGDDFYDSVETINGQMLASDRDGAISGLVDYMRYMYIENTEYQIEDGQYDEETVEELKGQLAILKSLTDEEWEEVEKAITKGYSYHYAIYDRRFKYNDIEFEAVGNILGGFTKKTNLCDFNVKSYNNININDFYKVAKKHHASCDVYRVGNDYENYYMLCGGGETGTFIKVNIENCDYKQFKVCDAYKNRYKQTRA